MKKLFNIVKLCLKNIKLFMQSWANCILLAFVFTVCVFAPLDYFFASRSEFWFSFADILIPVVVVSVTAGVALWVVFKFLKQTVKQVTAAIVFSITIAAYIQGNFLNINYGVLDGQTINWAQYRAHGMVNALIWIAIIILMVVLYAKFKEKFLGVARFAALFLVGMQAITLITNGAIVELATGKQDPYYLSDKGAFELSSNKNTIVFVLDTFDDKLMNELMETTPNILEAYDGFTLYPNSVAHYGSTKGGLPFLLTGSVYKNEVPYLDFLTSAYEGSLFYKELKEKQYKIGLYTNTSIYIPPSQKALIDNMSTTRPQPASYFPLGEMTYKLAGFRYFPHILKQFFWINTENFEELETSKKSGNKRWSANTLRFYNQLKDKGVTAVDTVGSYQFYHIMGAHPPYILDQNIQISSSATRLTQGEASLKIVEEFLEQMKKLDIYDDASIIVTADHAPLSTWKNTILLLHKPPNSRGAVTESLALVSQQDLQATIMKDITPDYEKYGQAIQDLSEENERKITTYRYDWDSTWESDYLPKLTEYVVTKLEDELIFTATGDIYEAGEHLLQEYPAYGLGESASAQLYFNGSVHEDNWFSGDGGILSLRFEESSFQDDLLVTIGIAGINHNQQRINIYGDSHVLSKRIISSGTPAISFIVPKEYVKDGRLLLNVLCPDAISAAELGTGTDTRALSFLFTDLTIKPVSSAFATYSMEKDKQLSFSESEKAVSYFTEGTVLSEWKTMWTVGKQGHINMLLEEIPPKNSQIVLQLANVFNGPQRLIVKNKENIIYNEIITEADTQIAIPVTENCFEGRLLQLELEYPDAISAAALDTGEDTRELAFGFSGMQLVPVLEDNDEHLFSIGEQVLANFPSGMLLSEWRTGWTLGTKGSFVMELKEAPKKDAQLIFKLSNVFNGPQRFIVKSNGTVIFEKTITEGDSQIAVPVSSACFNGNLLELDLEYPDAISAKGLGVGEDIRELALGFSGFQLVETAG